MEGPLAGDVGSRVLVLHPGQVQQCSNCLKLADSGCPGKGNGKTCVAIGAPRTQMGAYINMIKGKHGYRSLKARYYEKFPNIGGTGSSGLEIVEREECVEDDTMPMNPIEETDAEIANLKLALDASTQACGDLTAVKNNLTKSKSELKNLRWSTNLNSNKIEFARKVVEQSINLCLSDSTLVGEKEKELVTLYSTLIDEENFEISDDDICFSKAEFLGEAEKHLKERGEISQEVECLTNFKTKILEAVKKRKLARRSRKDSLNGRDRVGSQSSLKRSQMDQNGSESSRAKLETQ